MLGAMQSLVKPIGRILIQRHNVAAMSSLAKYKFETLEVTSPNEFVYHVQLNRPKKLNAMNSTFWREMSECFKGISTDGDCRTVVISANGKHFTAGLDLSDMGELMTILMGDEDVSRRFRMLDSFVSKCQDSFTSMEKCNKPVIAAVHSACIGAGVDMISAADIRLCTQDAYFQIKEVDLGLAADLGTLQRMPKIIGNDSLVRELAYTARKMYADEALRVGMIGRIFRDKEAMVQSALEMATVIASKSPVAVQGSKEQLNYARDHTVDEGLRNMVLWNAAHLQSEDVRVAAMAQMDRSAPPPTFSKL